MVVTAEHELRDSRYASVSALSSRSGRTTLLGEDRLLGRRVVLKTDDRTTLLHECATLLALPPGTGPDLLDLFVDHAGRHWAVVEHLDGVALEAVAQAIDAAGRPRLFVEILDQLLHVHRVGIVHADVKPSNLLVGDGFVRAGARVCEGLSHPGIRLLDFGSSRWNSGLLAPRDHDRLAGTPPYAAPEILRGWAVDGRADQYSLGVLWRLAFPDATAREPWAPLLERMTEARPARRFETLRAVRDAVEGAFDPVRTVRERAVLGGGALRGRREDIHRLRATLTDRGQTARVLLKAIPDTGLTRFLTTFAIRQHRRDEPIRYVDLGFGREHARSTLDEMMNTTIHPTILGIGDPAADTTWTSDRISRRVCPRASGADQFVLRPIRSWFFTECVVQSLGFPSREARAFSERLNAAFESRWRPSARALEDTLARDGAPRGVAWTLGASAGGDLAVTDDMALVPAPDDADEPMRAAMALLAHAGRRVRVSTARDLLETFLDPDVLGGLADEGHLVRDGDTLVFPTPRHREAARRTLGNERAVDEWLNANLVPAEGDGEAALEASHRACRLGDGARERAHLERAIEHAFSEQSYATLRELLAYPDPAFDAQDGADALDRMAVLSRRLSDAFTPQRLAHYLACALAPIDFSLAAEIFETVVDGRDERWAAGACHACAMAAMGRGQTDRAREVLARLQSRFASPPAFFPGLVPHVLAWIAFAEGDRDSAVENAIRAFELTEVNAGWPYFAVRTTLAIMLSDVDPDRSVEVLEDAMRHAPGPSDAQILLGNLSNLLSRLGRLEEAWRASERAAALLDERYTTDRNIQIANIRSHIALGRDDLEATRPLLEQLAELVPLTSRPDAIASTHHLMGTYWLYRGVAREAFASIQRASIAARSASPSMAAVVVDLLATSVLDLDGTAFLREQPELLETPLGGSDLRIDAMRRRLRALSAELDDDPESALEQLTLDAADITSLSDPELAGRLLHHRAWIAWRLYADRGDVGYLDRVRRDVEDAERALGVGRYRYTRGRVGLLRARVRLSEGRAADALSEIDRVIGVARARRFDGLLVDALRQRASALTEDS